MTDARPEALFRAEALEQYTNPTDELRIFRPDLPRWSDYGVSAVATTALLMFCSTFFVHVDEYQTVRGQAERMTAGLLRITVEARERGDAGLTPGQSIRARIDDRGPPLWLTVVAAEASPETGRTPDGRPTVASATAESRTLLVQVDADISDTRFVRERQTFMTLQLPMRSRPVASLFLSWLQPDRKSEA